MSLAFTVIGRYQIVDRLEEGGMGTVYLARDPTLDRLVAIKVLRGGFDNDDLRERFSREARAVSRLRHPNIVTIFEYGDFQGQPYIAMEYISGESLREVIRRRAPLPLTSKLQMMEELCVGMGYAHRAKIIHRDLKPANIMLDAEGGQIKILDFGIARNLESVTRFTRVIGTPSYMSPEQASAGPIDHRSDIFSLGLVFYELLSYRRAFDGESQTTILEKIQRAEPVPITQFCPDLDPAIVHIVTQAIEKEPANRYQDLDAMRADLVSARERTSRSARDVLDIAPPGAGAVAAPTPRPSSALEKRRASQIRQHLDAADSALKSRDYQAVIESCEQVLLLDETNAQALTLFKAVRSAIEEADVQTHLQRARSLINEGALTAAEAALGEVLTLRAADPAGLVLQRELQQIRRDRELALERAAAAATALVRARASLAEGALESAVRAASEALAYAPDSTEAQELKRLALAAIDDRRRQEELQQRANDAVAAARRRFDAGEHAAALAELERFTPPTSTIALALTDMRQRLLAIEVQRQADKERGAREAEERRKRDEEARRREQERLALTRRIEGLFSAARLSIAESDFDAALERLAEVRHLDPAATGLVQIEGQAESGRVRKAQEARTQQEQAEARDREQRAREDARIQSEKEEARLRAEVVRLEERAARLKQEQADALSREQRVREPERIRQEKAQEKQQEIAQEIAQEKAQEKQRAPLPRPRMRWPIPLAGAAVIVLAVAAVYYSTRPGRIVEGTETITEIPTTRIPFTTVQKATTPMNTGNRLEDEGNAALAAADADTRQAVEKLNAINGRSLTADRDQIKTLARAAADLLAKSADGLRDAAAKFQKVADDASDIVIKDYFRLNSQSVLKLADSRKLEQERVEVYLDDTIASATALLARQAPIAARAEAAFKEHEAIGNNASKLAQGHKEGFPPLALVPVVVDVHPWAHVTIVGSDGVPVAGTPRDTPFTISLRPGTYQLNCANDGLTPPRTFPLTVSAGSPQTFSQIMPGFDPNQILNKLLGPPK